MSEDKQPVMSREEIAVVIGKTPFAVWVGASLDTYRHGEVEISIPMRRELTQHHGFGHGAIIGFLADSACAWAAASVAGDVVTSEYKLNMFAPAVGQTLVGHGQVLHFGGRHAVCRADVHALSGTRRKLVATALATIFQVKP